MAASYDAEGLENAFFASITYVLVYAFMNLGAFAVVIAGAERTGSGEIDDWGGLSRYAPGVAVLLAGFFFALAGIPPLSGWFAKFVMFRAVMGGTGGWGVALAVIAAVNAVIALFYYARVVKTAFMDDAPEGIEPAGAVSTPALALTLGITAAVVVASGFFPQILSFFGDTARTIALGG
jgi:NADH-quinone oxidoreductase subunit N